MGSGEAANDAGCCRPPTRVWAQDLRHLDEAPDLRAGFRGLPGLAEHRSSGPESLARLTSSRAALTAPPKPRFSFGSKTRLSEILPCHGSGVVNHDELESLVVGPALHQRQELFVTMPMDHDSGQKRSAGAVLKRWLTTLLALPRARGSRCFEPSAHRGGQRTSVFCRLAPNHS